VIVAISPHRVRGLAVRGEPSNVATTGIVDRRRVAGRRLAADDLASGIIVRDRAAAVGRGPPTTLPPAS
jgi:hypothetical protein